MYFTATPVPRYLSEGFASWYFQFNALGSVSWRRVSGRCVVVGKCVYGEAALSPPPPDFQRAKAR